MVNKIDVAKFFFSLDKDRTYFNMKPIHRAGRTFYEGNARLNKLMHLSQNIFIAMNSSPLIDTDFYAYDNGAVIPFIQENYPRMRANDYSDSDIELTNEIKIFLRKIFSIFADAPIEELIEIDHEDPAWLKKHNGYRLDEQKMNSMKYIEDYKERYRDIIEVMNRLELSEA